MKVTVLQENLAHGLNVVSRAVSPRSTLPVLSNILIATDDGRLRLSATNLEMSITCWIGAKIEENGSTTVPSRTFSDFIGTLPNEQIEISLDHNTQTLSIHGASSDTDIKCIDAEEFPPISVLEIKNGLEFEATEFKEMVRQVAFSTSSDEARPVLTGVYMKTEDNQLSLASADGFRLSLRKTNATGNTDPVDAIIPARALNELARIISEKIVMMIRKDRGQVVFKTGNIELTSQLIEGHYPDFNQIIPTTFNTRTVLSTEMFLKACKQAEIFAREGSHIARFNVQPNTENGQSIMEISASSEETGKNETTVEATVEGDPLTIAFNVKFMREALDAINSPNVAIETTVANAPALIRQLGDERFIHVIMPMHIGNV